MKWKIQIIDKINETKIWFFEKVNKIDKPPARLTKQKEDRNYQYQEGNKAISLENLQTLKR